MRNNIKSRKAIQYEGHSLKLESVCKIDWLGSDSELLNMAKEMPTQYDMSKMRRAQKTNLKAQIALSKTADSLYRALSDAKVFNLSLEVATQFNLCRFADKSQYEKTSDKLRTNVLYIETQRERFEISRFTDDDHNQFYRLAKVSDPYLKNESFFNKTLQLPLSEEHIEQVMAEKVKWTDFKWGQDSLIYSSAGETSTAEKIQPIVNYMFRPIKNLTNQFSSQHKNHVAFQSSADQEITAM